MAFDAFSAAGWPILHLNMCNSTLALKLGKHCRMRNNYWKFPDECPTLVEPSNIKVDLSPTVDPETLRAWLTKPCDTLGARSLG